MTKRRVIINKLKFILNKIQIIDKQLEVMNLVYNRHTPSAQEISEEISEEEKGSIFVFLSQEMDNACDSKE